MLNVSNRSVERARVVLDKATPEVVELVEEGELAASTAASVAKATPDGRSNVAAKIRNGKRRERLAYHMARS